MRANGGIFLFVFACALLPLCAPTPYDWDPSTALCGSTDPIVVVGCGHSGTSIVVRLLGASSGIYAVPGETYFFNRNPSPESIQTRRSLWQAAAVSAGKRRWVEKTPIHVHHLGAILRWVPDVQVVIMIRDGRDTIASLTERRGVSFQRAMNRWIVDNLEALQWKHHPQVFTYRLEDLQDPTTRNASLRRLFEFLHEPYNATLPETFFLNNNNNNTAETNGSNAVYGNGSEHTALRSRQVNRPLFDARGKWKHILSTQQILDFQHQAGPLQRVLGYPAGAIP